MSVRGVSGLRLPERGEVPVTFAPAAWAAAMETLLPEGSEHVVEAVGEDVAVTINRGRWATRLRIVEGEHAGRELLLFCPMPTPENPLARSSVLYHLTVLATGKRPPSDVTGITPMKLLKGRRWVVRAVTVKLDSRRIKRPPDCWYSRAEVVREAPSRARQSGS